MLDTMTVIYCICDEVWKVLGLNDNSQCRMSPPEVMTFVIISSHFHDCNYQRTRLVSKVLHYFPKIISLSQLVRRIHKIPQQVWHGLRKVFA